MCADPRISVANGDYLTASTAGITGAFRVTARDSFENKRPGGDTVNALMALWNPGKDGPIDPSADPDTGTVKDNRDGQFEISYRLTRAGMYRMDLQVTRQKRISNPAENSINGHMLVWTLLLPLLYAS
jgi:hypothetical protein